MRVSTCRYQAESADFEVWCDKEGDRRLFNSLKGFSEFLNRIVNVHVMPSTSVVDSDKDYDFLRPVVRYDRADINIFHHKHPVLIIELTEHGYTGDNSLQRFARIANAGEIGIPLIYFTPFSRSRIDEIETSRKATSKRHVSRRLFEGFQKIYEIHDIPIMPVDWKLGNKGLAKKVSLNATKIEKRSVFDELVKLIEHLCHYHTSDIESHTDISSCQEVAKRLALVDQLAKNTIARESEVKIDDVPFSKIAEVVYSPTRILQWIGSGENYFYKGKDQKLVTLMCLQNSVIKKIQTPTGSMIDKPPNREEFMRLMPRELVNRPCVIYFCGYEKRSEPNGGIAVNTDYCMCRTGKTVRDRKSNLVVVWPRVFLDQNSKIREYLLNELKSSVDGERSALSTLIRKKCEMRGLNLSRHKYIEYSDNSVGCWSEYDMAARIYRTFCDVLVLNDALLLGNHWLQQNSTTIQTHLSSDV